MSDDVTGSVRFGGHLRLRASYQEDGYTYLSEQAFRAPFHLSKPYWEGRALVVQVVNPTAGVLEGDALEAEVTVGPRASVLVSTPSATRIFTMRTGGATSRQNYRVEAGGWLEVSPEPLVPHKGARFHQVTNIDVERGGEGFWADLFMPGRLARGEVWAWEELALTLELRVGGVLCLREHWRQSGDGLRRLAALAGAAEGACFANLVVVSPKLSGDLSWRFELARLHEGSVWLGSSPLRGECDAWSIRIIAPDSIRLRDTLAAVRRTLSRTLPALAVEVRKF